MPTRVPRAVADGKTQISNLVNLAVLPIPRQPRRLLVIEAERLQLMRLDTHEDRLFRQAIIQIFIVLVEDAQKVQAIALGLGYRILDDGKEIASYVRDLQRFDVMHAQRPISRDLLGRAVEINVDGMKVPVIPVEGLIGLKVQAYNDNPKRLQDVMDMVELFRINQQTLNMDEVRSYFRLFDRERLLDDILRAAR